MVQDIQDEQPVYCENCGAVLGEWIAIEPPPNHLHAVNYHGLIVEVLLPAGYTYDEGKDTCRLSNRERKRREEGVPSRRRAELIPRPRGYIATTGEEFSRFLEWHIDGQVLAEDQRKREVYGYRETTPLPAQIECERCRVVNRVTLDATQERE